MAQLQSVAQCAARQELREKQADKGEKRQRTQRNRERLQVKQRRIISGKFWGENEGSTEESGTH